MTPFLTSNSEGENRARDDKNVVVRPFNRRGVAVEVGSILDVPTDMLPRVAAYVAWIDGGELKTLAGGVDLAPAIVTLTAGDLTLQRQLLERYVQTFGPAHIGFLFEAWRERAAIMEHDGGMTKEQAEEKAARLYHLTAWLPELRGRE
jgi:hypothetical protein